MEQKRRQNRATKLIVLLVLALIMVTTWSWRMGSFDKWIYPSTKIHKPMFQVIDMHAHLHPSALGEAVRLMDLIGLKKMINLSGGYPGGLLGMQLQAARQYPGRFVVFTSPDFSLLQMEGGVQKMVRMLKKAVKMGARGLKIHKGLGLHVRDASGKLLPVDAPLLDPLWRTAGKLGIPVSIHTGDPKAFFDPISKKNERYAELSLNPQWSFANKKRFPRWEQLLQQFQNLVKRHSKTTFIGVHFGNHPEDVMAVGKMMSRLPNLYIDLAARLPEIGRQDAKRVREMFIKYQDRIFFATDLAIWLVPLHAKAPSNPSKKMSSFGYRYILGAPQPKPSKPMDVVAFYRKHWTYLETATKGMKNPTPIQGNWLIDGIQLPKSVLKKIYFKNAQSLLKRTETNILKALQPRAILPKKPTSRPKAKATSLPVKKATSKPTLNP